MRMREWTEYYMNSVKRKILNVISLEFSNTRYQHIFSPHNVECIFKQTGDENEDYHQPRDIVLMYNQTIF